MASTMEKMLECIAGLYGIDVKWEEKVTKGFLSENHILADNKTGKKYFLKRYRFDTKDKIQQIHIAKFYFAEKAVPVIIPIADKDGKTFFVFEEAYFALFPYINGHHIESKNLTIENINSLAQTLGAIHKAGMNAHTGITEVFAGWNKEKLLIRNTELISSIEHKTDKNAFDIHALEDLKLRRSIIESNTQAFEDFELPANCLIHGDYHIGNVFFDNFGHVSHVFDFEKTIYAPRTFELFRSTVFIFFGTSISTDDVHKARLYIQAYRAIMPTSSEELKKGFRLFFLRFVHGFWVQNEHYLKGNTRVDQFLIQDYERTLYFSEHLDDLIHLLID